MLLVNPGQSFSVTNPGLVFYHYSVVDDLGPAGLMADPYELGFKITDNLGTQVFPGSGYQTVNLTTDKLGTGRHAATFTAANLTAGPGRYILEWRWKPASTSAYKYASVPFQLLRAGDPMCVPYVPKDAGMYALPIDVRAEGAPAAASDPQLVKAILLASQFIEKVCGRHFEPRHKVITFDGTGGTDLLLREPVIAVEEMQFLTLPTRPAELVADLFRVYNRHLRGLLQPDDRNDPKVGLFQTSEDLLQEYRWSKLIFPRGKQNILVKGVFGYTEMDGTPMGCVPVLLQQACALLALRFLQKGATRTGPQGFAVTNEKTRDQSVSYGYSADASRASIVGAYTGDPQIDQILSMFVRPPVFLAALLRLFAILLSRMGNRLDFITAQEERSIVINLTAQEGGATFLAIREALPHLHEFQIRRLLIRMRKIDEVHMFGCRSKAVYKAGPSCVTVSECVIVEDLYGPLLSSLHNSTSKAHAKTRMGRAR